MLNDQSPNTGDAANTKTPTNAAFLFSTSLKVIVQTKAMMHRVATNGPTRVRTTQFGASLMRLTIPVHA